MSIESLGGWLAAGLGIGYLPVLAGTAGALAGVPLAMATGRLGRRVRAAAIASLAGLSVLVCEYGGESFAGDDRRIVADELLTFPVATAALPINRHPALLATVFVASRVLDGLKPPPAGVAERLPGGLGIVFDDLVTNAWSLLLGLFGWHWWCRRRSVPDR